MALMMYIQLTYSEFGKYFSNQRIDDFLSSDLFGGGGGRGKKKKRKKQSGKEEERGMMKKTKMEKTRSSVDSANLSL